jgi:hypothetical protein
MTRDQMTRVKVKTEPNHNNNQIRFRTGHRMTTHQKVQLMERQLIETTNRRNDKSMKDNSWMMTTHRRYW